MTRLTSAALGLILAACNSSNFAGSGGATEQPARPAKASAPTPGTPSQAGTAPSGTTYVPSVATTQVPVTPAETADANPAVVPDETTPLPVTPEPSLPLPAPAPVPDSLPPAPSGAMAKGSFRVWTVPFDPAPFQEYQIVVEVTLPNGTAGYNRSDLSGEIRGTEGIFSFTLGSDELAPSQFEVGAARARLTTWIPNEDAGEGSGDIITVRSQLLGETQSFSIAF